MSFNVILLDETWGDHRVLEGPVKIDNFATAKASIVQSVEAEVRDLRRRGIRYSVATLPESATPKGYTVTVTYYPEGLDGLVVDLVYSAVHVNH